MGYRLKCLDERVFMAVSKPLLTEFGIHHRWESCGQYHLLSKCCTWQTLQCIFGKLNKFATLPAGIWVCLEQASQERWLVPPSSPTPFGTPPQRNTCTAHGQSHLEIRKFAVRTYSKDPYFWCHKVCHKVFDTVKTSALWKCQKLCDTLCDTRNIDP